MPGAKAPNTFPSLSEFQQVIKYLPCWKAAGPDGIYNFFIKRCASLHEHLYRIVRRICLDGSAEEEWFYSGITYLIPKGVPT